MTYVQIGRSQKQTKYRPTNAAKIRQLEKVEAIRQATAAFTGRAIPKRLDGSYSIVNTASGEVLVSGRTRARHLRRRP